MRNEEKHALLRERLCGMHLACTERTTEQLVRYQELLETWNKHMNLTGDASFHTMLDRHLMDSLTPLTIAGLLPENAAVIDVGSGAGLPGIPLAVIRPDLQITLLDSQQKRVGFLQTVIEALGLENTGAVHARAEDAARELQYRERFDAALARAVAALPVLEELLLPFVRVGGKTICYKGPAVAEEMNAGKAAADLLGGGSPRIVSVSALSAQEQGQRLIVTEKLRSTPPRYPRKAGIPAKSPLGQDKERTP